MKAKKHSNNRVTNPLIMLMIFFIAFGLVFLIAGIIAPNITKMRGAHEYTIATIVRIERDAFDDEKDYDVYVEYNIDGVTYESRLGSYSSNMRTGDRVKIYYLKDNPNVIGYPAGEKIIMIVFTSVGGIFIIAGFIMMFSNIKNINNKKTLMKTGKKINTKFLEVRINRNYSVNNHHPFRIYTNYLDETTQSIYEFKSENIWKNPTEIIQFLRKESFTVYVKGNNYKKYYMDISEITSFNQDIIGTTQPLNNQQSSNSDYCEEDYKINEDDYKL